MIRGTVAGAMRVLSGSTPPTVHVLSQQTTAFVKE